jgi:hypothetical protein
VNDLSLECYEGDMAPWHDILCLTCCAASTFVRLIRFGGLALALALSLVPVAACATCRVHTCPARSQRCWEKHYSGRHYSIAYY